MAKNVRILVFSGRSSGNCAAIADYIAKYHKEDTVQIHGMNGMQPCGNCDYECLKPDVCCPNVTADQKSVMDAVGSSDLTYYVIPNICGLPCAAYFAFNERGIGYFNGDRTLMGKYLAVKKRFVIVSNTESDSFLKAAAQQTSEAPDMLYMKTGKYGKRSTAGDILESDAAQADLRAFLDA